MKFLFFYGYYSNKILVLKDVIQMVLLNIANTTIDEALLLMANDLASCRLCTVDVELVFLPKP